MQSRIKQAAANAREAGHAALLITHLADVRYLTGFTGSNAALVLTKGKAVLFTDGRYTTQAKAEVQGARVIIPKKKSVSIAAAEWLVVNRIKQAAFDPAHTTAAQLDQLRKAVPGKFRRGFFQPTATSLIATQREIKDVTEIRLMRRAAELGCSLFEGILTLIESGMPETVIAAHIEYVARLAGVEGMSFSTIVASGPRSALPHGTASTSRIPRKGFITLDFGVILNGYCSDMTRTVHIGSATAEEQQAYAAVLEAQLAAVDAVRPGATCGEVDEAARSILRRAGLAKFFTHSTGHGVGLEIHEGPRIAANQKQPLSEGMVITIEPGVYLPGRFGIRIEDTVVVTKKGCQILTPVTKAFIQL